MNHQNLTTEGTLEQMQEKSRRELAIKLLWIFAGILTLTVLVVALLLWYSKLTFANGLSLILAISSIFSGLLGSAITFYFSATS